MLIFLMQRPSDHLLRTLAAVPPSCNILEVGCGEGLHTESLLRLGFPVHACDDDPDAVAATRERITDLVGADTAETCVQQVAPDEFGAYPDDAFHWVIAHMPTRYVSSLDHLAEWMQAMRRLLIPGGWLYLATAGPDPSSNGSASMRITPQHMNAGAATAGLAPAEAAAQAEEQGTQLVRAIYRLTPEGVSR